MATAHETSTVETQLRFRRSDIVLPLALLAAFSVSIFDLFSHWLANPWTRYSVVFIPLVAWVAYNEDYKRRHPRLGALLIVVAVLTQLVSVKADILALSRPALACGLIGMLLNRGFASKRCAVLSLFIVPIPYSLASDLAGVAIAEWALTGIANVLAIPYTLVLHVFSVGTTSLPVSATYSGLPLFTLVVGLSGYFGLRRRISLARTLRELAVLAVAVVPLQFMALVAAVIAVDFGSASGAAVALDRLTWFVPTVVVVYRTERAVARRRTLLADAAANADWG